MRGEDHESWIGHTLATVWGQEDEETDKQGGAEVDSLDGFGQEEEADWAVAKWQGREDEIQVDQSGTEG